MKKLKIYKNLYGFFVILIVVGIIDIATGSLILKKYGIDGMGYVTFYSYKLFGMIGFYIGFVLSLIFPQLLLAIVFGRAVKREKNNFEKAKPKKNEAEYVKYEEKRK